MTGQGTSKKSGEYIIHSNQVSRRNSKEKFATIDMMAQSKLDIHQDSNHCLKGKKVQLNNTTSAYRSKSSVGKEGRSQKSLPIAKESDNESKKELERKQPSSGLILDNSHQSTGSPGRTGTMQTLYRNTLVS